MSAQSGPTDGFNELSVDEIEAAESVEVTELPNMLLIEIDDAMTYVSNTPKNKLLFDRERFAVEGKSLYTLLHGNDGMRVVLSYRDPYVALSPAQHEDVYRLWFGSRDHYDVRTPVDQVESVLEGIIDAVEYEDYTKLKDVYNYVINNQVRRELVEMFLDHGSFADRDRVDVTDEGWVIDGMFLVTWEAKVYLYTDSWKEGSYDPRRSTQYEKPGEFVTIQPKYPDGTPKEYEPRDIPVGNATITLGELELLFIDRVIWMLDWEDNIDDPAKVGVIKRTFEEYRDLL